MKNKLNKISAQWTRLLFRLSLLTLPILGMARWVVNALMWVNGRLSHRRFADINAPIMQGQGGDNQGPRRPAGGPQGAPPDLDEVFKNWKKKIDEVIAEITGEPKKRGGDDVFGQGGGGHHNKKNNGTGGFGHFAPKFMASLGLVIALVFIGGWLFTGLYQVNSSERGVVMQFGRFVQTTEPGLNWRWPYPFQSHELVGFTNVRTFEVDGVNNRSVNANNNAKNAGTQMLTGDENLLLVHYTVQYNVKDAANYVFQDGNPEATTKLAAETAMREVVGSSTLDKVLYEDREEVARKARELMQAILDRYNIGIHVIRINLQAVRPPEQVQGAFDDAIKASQDRERQVNEGLAYKQDVVPKAHGTASRMIEEATGYRQSLISQAEGEASRFTQLYNQYKTAKDVTRQRLYLETMDEIFSRSKKIIIDPNTKSILSLESLGEKNAAESPAKLGHKAVEKLAITAEPNNPAANTKQDNTTKDRRAQMRRAEQ